MSSRLRRRSAPFWQGLPGKFSINVSQLLFVIGVITERRPPAHAGYRPDRLAEALEQFGRPSGYTGCDSH